MSHRRRARIPRAEYDERGHVLCRWCRKPVEGRGVYCSDACKDEFLIRRSPTWAGRVYRQRYGQKCAVCEADEAAMFARYEQALALLEGTPLEGLLLPFQVWQLDHVQPVADGGGECGLENYRLLCPLHHGGVTKVFLADLRLRRKSASPWAARARAEAGYRQPLPARASDPGYAAAAGQVAQRGELRVASAEIATPPETPEAP